jgi:hypothetical protein
MDKYYLYIINNKKSIRLSSSNSKSDLREKALKKIGNKIEKYNGFYLYRVKLMKVPKKEILADSKSKIKVIGGPLVAVIEKILINVKKDKTKLTSINGQSNRIYFSEKYLKTHKIIQPDTIDKIVWDWVNNKFNSGLFAVNIID